MIHECSLYKVTGKFLLYMKEYAKTRLIKDSKKAAKIQKNCEWQKKSSKNKKNYHYGR